MAKVAIGQLCSTAAILQNLKTCENLVQRAAAAGAKALFLPEASDYISSTASESVQLARSPEAQEFVQRMQSAAKASNLEINVGVHAPGDTDQRVKNVLLWINTQGQITQRYQKVHLFDVHVEPSPIIEESKSVEAGSSLVPPFATSVGNVGMLICYDIRFPEASLALRRHNAQIITYPSAFSVPTGQAHWKPLLQARAIETQSFVIAAAQAGKHNEKRESYGYGMIVDPWGKILAELDDSPEPTIAYAELDLERLKTVRREMPLLRRHDVYPDVGEAAGQWERPARSDDYPGQLQT